MHVVVRSAGARFRLWRQFSQRAYRNNANCCREYRHDRYAGFFANDRRRKPDRNHAGNANRHAIADAQANADTYAQANAIADTQTNAFADAQTNADTNSAANHDGEYHQHQRRVIRF